MTLFLLCRGANTSEHSEAVFWGTFDPPTLAHLNIVENTLHYSGEKIDHIWIIINNHGHKNYHISPEKRIALFTSMLSRKDRKRVRFLIQNTKNEYSYEHFKKNSKKQIIAVVGQDSFENWKPYLETLSANTYDKIFVFQRKHQFNKSDKTYIESIKTPQSMQKISSTESRKRLNEQSSAKDFLHNEVIKIIEYEGLYKGE